jgi:hypothetical protein
VKVKGVASRREDIAGHHAELFGLGPPQASRHQSIPVV